MTDTTTPFDRTPVRIVLKLTRGGHGTCILNDQDITNSVNAVEVKTLACKYTTVVLSLWVDELDADIEGDEEMPE